MECFGGWGEGEREREGAKEREWGRWMCLCAPNQPTTLELVIHKLTRTHRLLLISGWSWISSCTLSITKPYLFCFMSIGWMMKVTVLPIL